MASFNKKIRGLNAEIGEISSRLNELNGFQDIKPKSLIEAPYTTVRARRQKGAQDTVKACTGRLQSGCNRG